MPGHSAMTMPLMPSWSVAIAVVVLLAAGALHVSHAGAAHGFARWWHTAHVSMGAGMVVMFLLPHSGDAVLYVALAVVFGAHAAAMAVALPRVSGVDRRVWAMAAMDQLLMVYMLAPWVGGRPALLTYLAVAYLAVAGVAWLVVPESFTCMTPPRGVPVRDRVAPRGAVLTTGTSVPVNSFGGATGQAAARPAGAVALLDTPASTPTVAHRVSQRLKGNLTTGVRLTLMTMTVSMAWMLLAMQQM